MFGMKFYNEQNKKSDVPIVAGSENLFNLADENMLLKKEYFDRWKSCDGDFDLVKVEKEEVVEENNDGANEGDNEGDNEGEGDEENEEEEEIVTQEEKLNDGDEDEDDEERIYIISINDVPYYYEDDLTSARSTMWSLAKTTLQKNADENENLESTSYIFTNNLNNLSIITPYNLFFFYYHQTMCDLKIDYVVRHK